MTLIFVMAGLVPAIHVFDAARPSRRGCPRQARAWRVYGSGFRGLLAPNVAAEASCLLLREGRAKLEYAPRSEFGPTADIALFGNGPPLVVKSRQALALSLAIHELATNALKYEALSVMSGRVSISWTSGDYAGEPKFVFVWQEFGGPPIW